MRIIDRILLGFKGEIDEGFLKLVRIEEFDDAVIGIDMRRERLIYSIEKIVLMLVKEKDMNRDDAIDYFYYNVECIGLETEFPPIFCYDYF